MKKNYYNQIQNPKKWSKKNIPKKKFYRMNQKIFKKPYNNLKVILVKISYRFQIIQTIIIINKI